MTIKYVKLIISFLKAVLIIVIIRNIVMLYVHMSQAQRLVEQSNAQIILHNQIVHL